MHFRFLNNKNPLKLKSNEILKYICHTIQYNINYNNDLNKNNTYEGKINGSGKEGKWSIKQLLPQSVEKDISIRN